MTRRFAVQWKTRLMISVLLVGVSSCATTRVGFYIDPNTDFSNVETYAWEAADIGDPRLSNDPLFASHVRSSVEQQLTAKRIQKASPDSADLLIRFHVNVEDKAEFLPVNIDEPNPESRVIAYEEGTLILDIAEAGTKRIIWRGWAQTDIDRALNDPQLMEKKIREATRRMFERFPPGR